MTINYSEYNNVHLPIADNLVCFIKGLEHAMQKTNDFDGAMHQLKCIGYDKALATVESVAHEYKHYHKQRIYAEQTANEPSTLYPTIKPERLKDYAENLRVIEMIESHEDSADIRSELEDVLNTEISVNASTFLDAYVRRDVDAMVEAITGWDLEALFVKTNIIPDIKGFFPSRDVRIDEIAFPLYGKESLTVEEFKAYLTNVHHIHDDTLKMVQSVINFVQFSGADAAKRSDLLWAVLKDYGIPENVVRMVNL